MKILLRIFYIVSNLLIPVNYLNTSTRRRKIGHEKTGSHIKRDFISSAGESVPSPAERILGRGVSFWVHKIFFLFFRNVILVILHRMHQYC